jgi:hypothetical protein
MSLNINLNDSVVSKVKVKADPALNNLCSLRLVNVEVTEQVSVESKEDYEYHGMNIPNLIFEFEQDHSDGIERFLTYAIKPVVSVKNDGSINPTKTRNAIYLSQYKHVRHIYDAFTSLPNVIPMDKLKLPELKTEGVDKEQHLKDVKKWFQAMATWFIGTDKNPIYLNANGDGHKLLTKLIINKNAKTIDIPQYINDGFIELLKMENGKIVTGLEIKPNESVVYQAVGGNMPNGGVPVPGGVPSGMVDVESL